MNEGLDVREFISGYLAEADELLSAANTNLLSLDASTRKQEHNPRAVRELFRALHTLKGLSAMVAVEPIVELTHQMEALLRSADRAAARIPDAALDLLVQALREVSERVAALSRNEPVAPAPKALLDALGALQLDTAAFPGTLELVIEPELLKRLSAADQQQMLLGLTKGRRALRVEFAPTAERAERGITITSVRERLQSLGELVKVVPRSLPSEGDRPASVAFVLFLVTDATDAAVAEAANTKPEAVVPVTARATADTAGSSAPEGSDARHSFVRVEVSRLDDTLERLSALVVGRARMERAVADLLAGRADARTLVALLNENARDLRDLRASIMRARMVRVSELLERAPLVVRSLARASGKLVNVTVEAGDAELDKAVADRLFPVIVHLLRNAVDHAIELPQQRTAAGKRAEGQIRVACVERAGKQLELQIIDDGRGIDAEAVGRRAGVPTPQSAAELLDVLTRPGFTTLDRPTTVSGRGYGMDIVRKVTVDELGGELSVATQPGAGSTFSLRVPLSITIIDALSFMCAGETFVVPLSAVDDLTELGPKDLVDTPGTSADAGGLRLFRHRGGTLPLLALDSVLGLKGPPAERQKVIVVRHRAERVGFRVDRMLGQQEIVVRPITDALAAVKGIAGSTDLGDGRPTLVLDLPGLLSQSRTRSLA